MKRRFFYLLWSALAIGNSSCKEDIFPEKDPASIAAASALIDERAQLLEQAQAWFEIHQGEFALPPGKIGKGGIALQWDTASFVDLPQSPELIRIPVTNCVIDRYYTSDMSHSGYQDVLLRKISDTDFASYIIEVHPDDEYITKRAETNPVLLGDDASSNLRVLTSDADFTGYFLVFSSASGLLQYGERRERALVVSKLVI